MENELVVSGGYDNLIVLADRLAKSGIIPSSLRGKPNDVAVILMTGREMNLPPMMSLNFIHVIQGRPELSAMGKIAVIKRAFPKAIINITGDEKSATCSMARFKEDTLQTLTFTIEDARRAGLLTREPWQKFPATMLRWRVISMCARLVFPDVILGIYDADEIEDIPYTAPKQALDSAPEPAPQYSVLPAGTTHILDKDGLKPLEKKTVETNSGTSAQPELIFSFGQYKGKTPSEIPVEKLRSYYQWLKLQPKFQENAPNNKIFIRVREILGVGEFKKDEGNVVHSTATIECPKCRESHALSCDSCPNCGYYDVNEYTDGPNFTTDEIPF